MKKLIVLAVVAMVFGMVSGAYALDIDPEWVVQLRANNAAGTAQGTITCQTKVGASDNFVPPQDAQFPSPVPGYGEISITLGSVTRIQKDLRAPLTIANMGKANAKVWNLSMYINGGGAQTMTLKGWVPAARKLDGTDTIVELYQGSTLLWKVVPGQTGSSAAANYTGTFYYNNEPISLQLLAYVVPVPEPGSIVAMLTGMVGFAGYAIRRRK